MASEMLLGFTESGWRGGIVLSMVKKDKTKTDLSPDCAALNGTRRWKKWKQGKDECLKCSSALMEQREWVDKAAESSPTASVHPPT